MSLVVDELSATSCRVFTCRRVVWDDELSVDQLSVDGLSPHRYFDKCHSSVCQFTKYRSFECHSAEYTSVESYLTECYCDECHSVESCLTECYCDECPSAKWHSAKSHSYESLFAMSHSSVSV
jgi:hypothetical protein